MIFDCQGRPNGGGSCIVYFEVLTIIFNINILLKQIVVSKNENVIFSERRSERVQKGR